MSANEEERVMLLGNTSVVITPHALPVEPGREGERERGREGGREGGEREGRGEMLVASERSELVVSMPRFFYISLALLARSAFLNGHCSDQSKRAI